MRVIENHLDMEGTYSELLFRPIGIILFLAVIWSFYYGINRSRRETARLDADMAPISK